MLYSVFVGRMPNDTTQEELTHLFRECGEVKNVHLRPNKDMKYGFGFVRFSDPDSALKVVQDVGEWSLHGNVLKVELSLATKEALRRGTHPKVFTGKQVFTDNHVRSRIKDACHSLNKELDLIHGDSPVDSHWVVTRLEKTMTGFAPRCKGIPCQGARMTKDSLFEKIGVFTCNSEEEVQQRRKQLKDKMEKLESDLQHFCSEDASCDHSELSNGTDSLLNSVDNGKIQQKQFGNRVSLQNKGERKNQENRGVCNYPKQTGIKTRQEKNGNHIKKITTSSKVHPEQTGNSKHQQGHKLDGENLDQTVESKAGEQSLPLTVNGNCSPCQHTSANDFVCQAKHSGGVKGEGMSPDVDNMHPADKCASKSMNTGSQCNPQKADTPQSGPSAAMPSQSSPAEASLGPHSRPSPQIFPHWQGPVPGISPDTLQGLISPQDMVESLKNMLLMDYLGLLQGTAGSGQRFEGLNIYPACLPFSTGANGCPGRSALHKCDSPCGNAHSPQSDCDGGLGVQDIGLESSRSLPCYASVKGFHDCAARSASKVSAAHCKAYEDLQGHCNSSPSSAPNSPEMPLSAQPSSTCNPVVRKLYPDMVVPSPGAQRQSVPGPSPGLAPCHCCVPAGYNGPVHLHTRPTRCNGRQGQAPGARLDRGHGLLDPSVPARDSSPCLLHGSPHFSLTPLPEALDDGSSSGNSSLAVSHSPCHSALVHNNLAYPSAPGPCALNFFKWSEDMVKNKFGKKPTESLENVSVVSPKLASEVSRENGSGQFSNEDDGGEWLQTKDGGKQYGSIEGRCEALFELETDTKDINKDMWHSRGKGFTHFRVTKCLGEVSSDSDISLSETSSSSSSSNNSSRTHNPNCARNSSDSKCTSMYQNMGNAKNTRQPSNNRQKTDHQSNDKPSTNQHSPCSQPVKRQVLLRGGAHESRRALSDDCPSQLSKETGLPLDNPCKAAALSSPLKAGVGWGRGEMIKALMTPGSGSLMQKSPPFGSTSDRGDGCVVSTTVRGRGQTLLQLLKK